MKTGTTALTWIVGVLLIVLLLEYAPRLGGGLLLVLVLWLALKSEPIIRRS
jgi:hypothetical protein